MTRVRNGKNRVFALEELTDILGESLGDDKARKLLLEHAQSYGHGRGPFDLEQALAILESITSEPGIVGTTARFAKSRLHLMS